MLLPLLLFWFTVSVIAYAIAMIVVDTVECKIQRLQEKLSNEKVTNFVKNATNFNNNKSQEYAQKEQQLHREFEYAKEKMRQEFQEEIDEMERQYQKAFEKQRQEYKKEGAVLD